MSNVTSCNPEALGVLKPGINNIPDSKVQEANMGPTWVLSAPDGCRVGPMKLAIRDVHWNEILFATEW